MRLRGWSLQLDCARPYLRTEDKMPDINTIVSRLRAAHSGSMQLTSGSFLLKDAADEIERIISLDNRILAERKADIECLTAENEKLKSRLWMVREDLAHIVGDIDRDLNPLKAVEQIVGPK